MLLMDAFYSTDKTSFLRRAMCLSESILVVYSSTVHVRGRVLSCMSLIWMQYTMAAQKASDNERTNLLCVLDMHVEQRELQIQSAINCSSNLCVMVWLLLHYSVSVDLLKPP